MPVACSGLEVSFGVNHNQREWETFSWAFYFYHRFKLNQSLRDTLAVPVACSGLEVSFGVNHNQREWETFSWAFYFYHPPSSTGLGSPCAVWSVSRHTTAAARRAHRRACPLLPHKRWGHAVLVGGMATVGNGHERGLEWKALEEALVRDRPPAERLWSLYESRPGMRCNPRTVCHPPPPMWWGWGGHHVPDGSLCGAREVPRTYCRGPLLFVLPEGPEGEGVRGCPLAPHLQDVLEKRRGAGAGGGSGPQKNVYEKWPKIFSTVNFAVSHDGHLGLGGGGGGLTQGLCIMGGGGPPSSYGVHGSPYGARPF